MALFKSKPKTNLGIDIGASAIKLAELERVKERYKLKTYGILPIAPYLESIGIKVNTLVPKVLDEQMIDLLKKIIQEAGAESKSVRLSVPVYSSFSTLIELPMMPEKEIAAAIPYEAKKYIPVPIEDVIMDWSIIEKPEALGPGNSVKILLVAVLKDVVEKYTHLIKSIDLEFGFMEAETFSLARCLIGNDKSTIVLVDIGSRASNISIVDGGFIRAIRNLELGGSALSEAISRQMRLDVNKAEALKITKESWPELDQIVHSQSDKIIKEITKLTSTYQRKNNRKIEKCIMIGSATQTLGMLDYFSSQLGEIEVSLGNPFARVVCPPSLQPQLKELGLSLAVAIGLAMRQ